MNTQEQIEWAYDRGFVMEGADWFRAVVDPTPERGGVYVTRDQRAYARTGKTDMRLLSTVSVHRKGETWTAGWTRRGKGRAFEGLTSREAWTMALGWVKDMGTIVPRAMVV